MKIYYVTDIDLFDEKFIDECASFFPEWRKDKMLRYKNLKGRVQNGLAYLLLIKALQEEGVFYEMPEFFYNERFLFLQTHRRRLLRKKIERRWRR